MSLPTMEASSYWMPASGDTWPAVTWCRSAPRSSCNAFSPGWDAFLTNQPGASFGWDRIGLGRNSTGGGSVAREPVVGCTIGIIFLGAALTGYLLTHMTWIERIITAIAALLLVVPGIKSGLIGAGLVTLVLIIQIVSRQRKALQMGNTSSAAANR